MILDNYEMVFWDFDGVIKESVSVKTDAFEQLFKPYGKIVLTKVKDHHIENAGMSRYNKIPLYLKWSGKEPTIVKVDEVCSQFSKIVKNKVISSDWVPGAESFIKNNRAKFKFIIVSATPQDELVDICQSLNIDNFFLKIYGSPTSKSSAIKTSMLENNILPQKCVMIGDARADIHAAKENNINFIFRRHQFNQNLNIDPDCLVIHDFNNK